MRVLMVSANYLPVIGGVETHVAQVAPRLRRAGVDVEVLTTDRTRAAPPHEVIDGVPVTRVAAFPRSRDYYLAPALLAPHRFRGWDVVHVQGYHTFAPPAAMAAALQARTPYVLTFHSGGHSSALRNRARGVQALLLRPLLARARRLIAVSEFERDVFRRRLGFRGDRFTVIPNGVDPRYLAPREEDDSVVTSAGPLIVSVGRLERYKGHHRAIRALRHLVRLRPGARLRIAGSGPAEPMLRGLAEALGVADRVEIAPVPAGDVAAMHALLASAAAVTVLSDYESSGLVAIEGAASGRPVLVARTSGLAELARHGWVDAIDPHASDEEIATALDRMLDRETASPPEDLPIWDLTAARLVEVYERVAARPQWTG